MATQHTRVTFTALDTAVVGVVDVPPRADCAFTLTRSAANTGGLALPLPRRETRRRSR